MQILTVSLSNFKVHRDRHFEFQPGINAICGENGSGKSSIIEAIAWTLFDAKTYTQTDLIRKGTKAAQVRVQFISSQDGRTYQVERCTSKGYGIYDPQLRVNLELSRKGEVIPWLQSHLGIPHHTTLDDLFTNVIGIPQGTFTADFLKTSRDRKQVFDPILQVEDYKQAFERSNTLRRYGEVQVEKLQQEIAHYTERLQDWETIQQNHTGLKGQIAQDELALHQAREQLAGLLLEAERLSALAQQLQQWDQQLQVLNTQLEAHQKWQHRLQENLKQSQEAVTTCTDRREAYHTYLVAEATLKALNQQAQEQQRIRRQRDHCWQTLNQHKTQSIALEQQLEQVKQSQAELVRLQPRIAQQEQWEHQEKAIGQEYEQLRQKRLEYRQAEEQSQRWQQEWDKLTPKIEQLQTLATSVAEIPTLEQQQSHCQTQISRLEAVKQLAGDLQALVHQGNHKNQQLQTQTWVTCDRLRALQGHWPASADVIQGAILTLETGVALSQELLAALQGLLAAVNRPETMDTLKQECRTLAQQLKVARQHQAEFAKLPHLQERQEQLRQDMAAIAPKLYQWQQELATEPRLQQQQAKVAAALKDLNNPRAQSQLLTRNLEQRPQLQQRYEALQRDHDQYQHQLQGLEQQLTAFRELEAQMAQQHQQKQIHYAAYDQYLRHRQSANQHSTLEAEWKAGLQKEQALISQRDQITQEQDQIRCTYDPQHYQALITTCSQIQSQGDRLEGSLPGKRQELARLSQELSHRQEWAQKRDRCHTKLQVAQQTNQLIKDAREIYRQAGPRITKYYLTEVSWEADGLYRELLNRQTLALDWTEDYDIRVQEKGYWRPFKSLSGGEQMCAALAVRLGLLKVLSEVDVAFFDEPTTNLDRRRRQQLAEAIANLRRFRQLFVISHDDTFEHITENVIRVEREA